jgi:hypothetical protein
MPGKYRIHLNTERWRVPEAWFSPSMAGVDSAGLGEVLQTVLARFSDADKGRLVKVRPPRLPAHASAFALTHPSERVRDRRALAHSGRRATASSRAPADPSARNAARHRARG